MLLKTKGFVLKYKIAATAALSFLIPFIIYLLTLEHKLVGGDTSWYAIQIPQMQVLVPTGYPVFSLIGKLMAIIPIGDLAYRLNLISAIFGAFTILFLFLAINKVIKNELVSLACSLSFAFLFTFWFIAVRLEFDTLNSFFIAFIIFSAVLYNESKLRKHLYLFFFFLGLSLTDHPIAFFVLPAFLFYIIAVNPKIFKSFKVISLSIIFFILPLFSYAYLPIRSLQGFGPVTTIKKFFYYVTGRETAGGVHGGSFGNKDLHNILNVSKEFILIIYNNFGAVLIIMAIIGFVYLAMKSWKFAVATILVPVLSMAIISQYLTWAPENYTIDTMLVMTVYISFGFLFILDIFNLLFKKWDNHRQPDEIAETFNQKISNTEVPPGKIPGHTENKLINKRKQILKCFTFAIIFLFFFSQPAYLAFSNYKKADLSKPEGIYLFWDKAFNNMEKNSILYTFTASENIGSFINLFEQRNKQITFIPNSDKRYSINSMKDNLLTGKTLYFVGNDSNINLNFNLQKIGQSYYWPRFNENLTLYKMVEPKFYINIEYNIDSKTKKVGDKFSVEYTIRNLLNKDMAISSIELELPDGLELTGVERYGSINIFPNKSKGIFMWVYYNYIIKGNSRINLILDFQAHKTGKIKFRVSTNDVFVKADDLKIKVQN